MSEDVDPTRIDLEVAEEFDWTSPLMARMRGIATHGRTPFDVPFISEIVPGFWQGGCQNGLVLPAGIKHVISLYPWERYTVNHYLSSFLEVRMYDSEGQGFDQVVDIARWVNSCRKEGETLVHCQAGLNRSSLVAATALILSGWEPETAIKTLRERRSPACLCNKSFEYWLTDFQDFGEREELEERSGYGVND